MDSGNVLYVSSTQWMDMLLLKNNVQAMKNRNEDGRCDIAIRKETRLLRNLIKEVIGSSS